jgi:hypothetical protein
MKESGMEDIAGYHGPESCAVIGIYYRELQINVPSDIFLFSLA